MAKRKTKAELRAEQTAKLQDEWEAIRVKWHSMLLDTVLAASKLDNMFQLSSEGQDLTFEASGGSEDVLHFWGEVSVLKDLPVEQNWDMVYDLETVNAAISRYYEHVAAERARRAAKEAALAKLTMEDRKLLGL